MKKIPRLFLLSLIPLFLCCSLLSFKEPKIEDKQVQIESVDLKKLSLKLILDIKNPNEIDLPLEGLKANLSIDENPFLERSWDNLPVLLKGKTTKVTLPMEIGWENMLKAALKFASNHRLPYRLKGTVKVKGFNLPFNESGELSLDQLKNSQK